MSPLTKEINGDLLSKLQAALQPKSLVEGGESAPATAAPVQSEGSWASIYGFGLPRDEQVAILLLQGRSRLNIAKELGIGPPTVYKLVQTPQFQTAFHTMQAELRESALDQKVRIELLCSTALDNIAHVLLNSNDLVLKTKTSFDVLDRGGHSIKHQAEITQKFEIGPEAAALISRSMDELKAARGQHDEKEVIAA